MSRRPRRNHLPAFKAKVALETECLIQQTIRELHSTCTIFMIAHRLSTVKEADVILVLDSGRVLEKGTVEQLLAYDSYFLRVSGMQGDIETLP